MFETPILYLIFNRPDLTEITFLSICNIKPKKLFIAADGPRTGNQDDELNCMIARQYVLSKIDWDCEVQTLFRDANLGCGIAVSSAISWFFSHVEKGIILEDDCLPDLSFFNYCENLLDYYYHDDEVMSISGTNLLGNTSRKNKESYFWSFGGIWGWATWRRAWINFDFNMSKLSQVPIQEKLRKSLFTDGWYNHYYTMFIETSIGKIDTWDAQWFFSILINNGISINPRVNLVKNIGFGASATHTKNDKDKFGSSTIKQIIFPLIHPCHKKIDVKYLKKLYKLIYPKLTFKHKVARLFRRYL